MLINLILTCLALHAPAAPGPDLDAAAAAFRASPAGPMLEACGIDGADPVVLPPEVRAASVGAAGYDVLLASLGEPPELDDDADVAGLTDWMELVRLQAKVGLVEAGRRADAGDVAGEVGALLDVADHLQRAAAAPGGVVLTRVGVDTLRVATLEGVAARWDGLDDDAKDAAATRVAALPEAAALADVVRADLAYLKAQGHPLMARLDSAAFDDFAADAGPVLGDVPPGEARGAMFAAASRFAAGDHDPAAELIVGHVADALLIAQPTHFRAADAERRLRDLAAP